MTAKTTKETIAGFEAVVMENSTVRVVVIPSLGGRVWELHDLERRRQWIWHRPNVPLVAVPPGSGYDEAWAGGWEELFPNDAPGRFEGRDLFDHGEWWTTPWMVADQSSGLEARVVLVAERLIRNAWCRKELRLTEDSDRLEISYRIESRDSTPFHFLFKQHLPVAITAGCRLMLPGGRVTPVAPGFGTLVSGSNPFEWPGGSGIDLATIPPASSAAREFVYVSELADGWCGVDDLDRRASLRFRFDRAATPFLWLFLTYGGWRDCYTAVLEPCTNMPKDLGDAVRAGQSAVLAPGQAFETTVSVSLGGLA